MNRHGSLYRTVALAALHGRESRRLAESRRSIGCDVSRQ
jgi:hypothetical protein